VSLESFKGTDRTDPRLSEEDAVGKSEGNGGQVDSFRKPWGSGQFLGQGNRISWVERRKRRQGSTKK